MAYINRELALKLLETNSITKHITFSDGVSIYDTIANIPTADVVPKSELSIIGVQNMALENTNVDLKRRLVIAEAVASAAVGKASEMIAEAKREVAREIFADLEAKAPWFCENQTAYEHFNEELAELKKKYTEANDDTE